MKKSRNSDSQILSILKQIESDTSVPELFREHCMSSASFYKWRAKHGGMDAFLMQRREMAKQTVEEQGVTIRLTCSIYIIREPFGCRYQPKLSVEDTK